MSPSRESPDAASEVFYVFGQDVRLAGARTAISSMPNSVIMGEIPTGPIPVELDDPLGRGDSEPRGGQAKLGDIISGAFSLYSARLQDALTAFGITLDFKPVQVFVPGQEQPVEGYAWVRGVPSIKLGGKALEFFTINHAQTGGRSFFDASVAYASVRVIDQRLKVRLEVAGLEGVYFLPTKDYGGALAMSLKQG